MPESTSTEQLSLDETVRLLDRLAKELDRVRKRKYCPFSKTAMADFDRCLANHRALALKERQ